SFDEIEGLGAHADLLAGVDLVLSDRDLSHVSASRQYRITPAWVQHALEREAPGDATREQQSPGDIVRILRTSGTTGRQKRIAFTRRMHELRTLRYAERYRFAQESRYLLTLPFSIGLPYGCATACLRAGGCVIPLASVDSGAFAKYGITHVTLLPHHL